MKKHEIQNTEIFISRLLQTGVLCSAAVILAGVLLYFITGSSGYPGSTYPTNLHEIFRGALARKPYAVMQSGLFLLILTPVLRVGISIFVFVKEKDRLYVRITALVFLILCVSFLLGRVE